MSRSTPTLEGLLAHSLAPAIAEIVAEAVRDSVPPVLTVETRDWKVLFWSVAPETRIKVPEVLAGFGKKKSWLYARTSRDCDPDERIPHRRGPDGEICFVVGELREWWRNREEIQHPGILAREEILKQHPHLEGGCT